MQVLASNPKVADKVAYKLSYRVRIMAAAGVKEVTCASHDADVRVDLTALPPTVSLSEEGRRLAKLPVCNAAARRRANVAEYMRQRPARSRVAIMALMSAPVAWHATHRPSLQPAHRGPAPLAVSDASKDFTLLVELSNAAGDALRSRLTLQQAERDGGAKTTAMAVFVPRCGLGC